MFKVGDKFLYFHGPFKTSSEAQRFLRAFKGRKRNVKATKGVTFKIVGSRKKSVKKRTTKRRKTMKRKVVRKRTTKRKPAKRKVKRKRTVKRKTKRRKR